MNNISQPVTLACPFCECANFTVEVKGKIFKSTTYECQRCKSVLETKNEKNFTVIVIGDEYSNTQSFMMNKVISREKLSDLGLPLFSDNQLSNLLSGEGELFEQFITQPLPETSVVLKSGESLLLVFNNVILSEERSQRVSSGSFSFRVMKGIWFHTGSIYKSEGSIQQIDSGTLVITNKRYVFVGSKKSVDQSLSKITSIQPFGDGIGILRSNKSKIEYYSGKYHWPLAFSLLMGILKKYL